MSLHKLSPIAILLVGAVILSSPNLHAGASNKSGSPYGNSSYFPNGGTYTGIARGSNGFLAQVTFTTTATNIASGSNNITNVENSGGASTVFMDGQRYSGIANGSVDPGSGTVGCTYVGYFVYAEPVSGVSNQIQSNPFTTNINILQTNVVQTNQPVYSVVTNSTIIIIGTNSSNNPIFQTNYVVTNIVTGYTNIYLTNITNVLTNTIVDNYTTNVIITWTTNTFSNWVSGQFTAQLHNQYPNQTFAGSGSALRYFWATIQTNLPGSTYPVSVVGVFYDTNTNTVVGSLINQGSG